MHDAHTIVIDFDKTRGEIPDWAGFEQVSENFLQKMYNVGFVTTQKSHDKGIDLVGEERGKKYVAQVKCSRNAIGADPIDAFITRKRKMKANVGIFVAATGFTAGAVKAAKSGRIDLYNFLDFCSFGYERGYKMYMFWHDKKVHFREPQDPKNNKVHSIYFTSDCPMNTKVTYRVDGKGPYNVNECNTCITFEGKHEVSINVDNKRSVLDLSLMTDVEIDIYKDSNKFVYNKIEIGLW